MKYINILYKSKAAKNGVWLYAMYFFNTAVPMITIPFITRMLGAEEYGVFTSASNLIIYLSVIVEYGFNLSGTRKLAIRESDNEIRQLYSDILFTKLLLTAGSFVIAIALLGTTLLDTKEMKIAFSILLMNVIGYALQQTWFFQGLKDLKPLAIINITARTISVIIIFLIIRTPEDIYYYCILYSLTTLLSGIFSVSYIRKKYKIKLIKPTWLGIKTQLIDGWYTFTTSAMSKVYGGIAVTVLTIVSVNPASVGIYGAISKIPIALTTLFQPISQVIYPYVCKRFQNGFFEGLSFVKKIACIVLLMYLLFVVIIGLNAEAIVWIVLGAEYRNSYELLFPLLIWIIASIGNNFLGIQILVGSGNEKSYSRIFFLSVVILICMVIIGGSLFEMYGIAWSVCCSEIILSIMMTGKIIWIYKKEKNQAIC